MHFPLRFTGVAGTTLISLVENCNGRVCSTFTKAGTSRVDTSWCIYVTDGQTAEIKIFRGSDYAQIGSNVKLSEDADYWLRSGHKKPLRDQRRWRGAPRVCCPSFLFGVFTKGGRNRAFPRESRQLAEWLERARARLTSLIAGTLQSPLAVEGQASGRRQVLSNAPAFCCLAFGRFRHLQWESNTRALWPSTKRGDNRCLLHQFTCVTHGNCQVRAAKVTENGEVHANDLAVAIEERSAGTAGGCCCIVNDFVL